MAAWFNANAVEIDALPKLDRAQICNGERGEELAMRAVDREAHYLGLGVAI